MMIASPHAVDRLRERYKLEPEDTLFADILDQIEKASREPNHRAIRIEHQRDSRERWLVAVPNRAIFHVIVSWWPRLALITFLPPNSRGWHQ